ncbi:MAG: transposase [Porticoccaceae bacterium]|nr:transposase [Porticoccaceae bacterium]
MARLPRYFVEGQAQHIIQRGNNREPIFAAEQDYQVYLECLQKAAEQNGLDIHSYILMTNHVHLLATPQTEDSIGKTLQSLGRRYVQYFNYSYKRTGTLWEGRYKATLIDSERYLLTCMRYIELNPVRANMVKHPGDYPWSSYLTNARGQESTLTTPHPLYHSLGRSNTARQSAYRALFRGAVSKVDQQAIREATNTGWVLGNDRFRDKIEQLSGRRSRPKRRGRPSKTVD